MLASGCEDAKPSRHCDPAERDHLTRSAKKTISDAAKVAGTSESGYKYMDELGISWNLARVYRGIFVFGRASGN